MKTKKLTYGQVFSFLSLCVSGTCLPISSSGPWWRPYPCPRSRGDEEGSVTGSERREGVGFTERGEEERLEAAERRAGIRCCGGSGTDWTDFTRPSVLRTEESGEETKGESLESKRAASGIEEVSSTDTSAGKEFQRLRERREVDNLRLEHRSNRSNHRRRLNLSRHRPARRSERQ